MQSMMDVSDRRRRKKQRTRDLIQETALELFASRGYHETTLKEIADAADVAARTVTLHFPAKEDLLFADDPFAPATLAARVETRAPGEFTLDAVRDWMATTMERLGAQTPDDPDRIWRQRATRMRMIIADDDLRGRARAGYYAAERTIAAGIGQDLGLPPDALAPRLAAITTITGLRELYETREAQGPAPSTAEFRALVDRVIDFARAGLAASTASTAPTAPTASTAPTRAPSPARVTGRRAHTAAHNVDSSAGGESTET